VINNNTEAQELELSRFAEGLDGNTSGKDVITGKQVNLSNNLSIKGKSSLVIELK